VGAYHGIELVYTFNYPYSFIVHYLLGLTGLTSTQVDLNHDGTVSYVEIYLSTGYGAADVALADTAMTIWTNFAKNGDPSVDGVITWPEYTTSSDAYVEIESSGSAPGYTLTSKTGIVTGFHAVE
jgi:para-nitrobenzyl esterase